MNIRFGIIGPGTIAKKFADAANKCENVTLQAVASRSIERGKAFAETYGVKHVYDNYDALINDPDVDAVYIALPNKFHVDMTKRCIEGGKAVLCEKPFAMNEKDARYIADLSKNKNVLFMEAMWTRFLPATVKTRQWLERGLIGEVKYIDSAFSFHGKFNPKGRLYDADLGGGALFDVGAYCVLFSFDMAKGYPSEVKGSAVIGKSGVDEVDAFTMKFDNGIIAAANCGIAVATDNDACIYGTQGRIVMHKFWACTKCECLDAKGNVIESFSEDEENGFVYEIRHFYDLWKTKMIESPIMPHKDTVESAAVYDSLRGQWGLIKEVEK